MSQITFAEKSSAPDTPATDKAVLYFDSNGDLSWKDDSGNVIKIAAAGSYTLTLPATGTPALLGTANTFTLLNTFSAGISLGNETLSNYDEGTWTPAVTGSTGDPTVTYTVQVGKYTRIGNTVHFSFQLAFNTYSGGSGDLRVSLPFTAANTGADNTRNAAVLNLVDITIVSADMHFAVTQNQAYGSFTFTIDNSAIARVQIADAAAGDTISASGHFWV